MKIIGVISGKGGVGKTTTVSNVGTAVASEFNRKVLLADGDPNNPDLPLHLGIYSVDKTLKDVLDGTVRIRDALTKLPSGADLLPAPFKTDELIDIRGIREHLTRLDEYEIVIVDSPPGLGREIEPIFKVCDEVIIVTNLEVPAVTQALKGIVNANKAGVPITGIVLNMVRGKKYELSPMEVELVFDAPVIGVIPEDWRVKGSVASGEPLILSSPSSPASTGFKKLAAYLVGVEYTPTLKERLKDWLRNFSEKIKKTEIARPQMAPAPHVEEEKAMDMEVVEVEPSVGPPVEPEVEIEPAVEPPVEPEEVAEITPEEFVQPPEEVHAPEEIVEILEEEPIEEKPEEVVEVEPEAKVEQPPKWEDFQEISVETKRFVPEGERITSQEKLEHARKRAITVTMEKLEESYEKGFIKENIYLTLKKKYLEELGSLRISY